MHDYIIIPTISILGTLFNVYAVNVLTSFNKKPSYYKSVCTYKQVCSEEELRIDNINRNTHNNIRKSFDHKKNIGLLLIGIIMIILSLLIKNPYIRNGFGLAGLITIIYATIMNWIDYDDKIRLVIITIGLIFISYIAIKIYNDKPIIPENLMII